jgi:hypothetical protein
MDVLVVAKIGFAWKVAVGDGKERCGNAVRAPWWWLYVKNDGNFWPENLPSRPQR